MTTSPVRRKDVGLSGNAGRFAPVVAPEADIDLFAPAPGPDAVEDADLAYLRSVLDRHDTDTAQQATHRPVTVVSGADMPPLVFSHPDPLDPSKVTRIRTEGTFPKPLGGLWATVGDIDDPDQTPWERYLDRARFRGGSRANQRSEVRLRDDARIAYIDSPADLQALAAECPNDPHWDDAYYDTFGERGDRPLDWEKVAERYDAVWVTQRAINIDFQPGVRTPLCVWDIESVVVTRPEALA